MLPFWVRYWPGPSWNAGQPAVWQAVEAELVPGQMTKSQFLAQLHDAACATAQEAMAGTIWSVTGCPYIEQWTQRYAGASASHLERAVLRYAPEAGGAKSAGAMIPAVCVP